MFRLQSGGPRSTLEEMLDLFRTNDMQDVESANAVGEETIRPPPLPVRPTSRARLPSSVRSKKAQNAAALKVPPPSGLSVNVIKEEPTVDSPVAKIESPTDCVALEGANDQVSTPEGLRVKPAESIPALTMPSTPSESKLDQIKSPLIGPGVNSIDRPNGVKGGLDSGIKRGSKLDFGNSLGDPGKTPNGSVANDVAGSVRRGLSVITPDQPAFQQMANLQTPPLTPPLTPPPTPPPELLSPVPDKKWKDDGVLRLRKVYATVQASLS